MDAEQMIKVWAASKLELQEGHEVALVRFEHEDGWLDDHSGTWWPESNDAVVTVAFNGARGQRREYERKVPLSEGVEGFQSLLQDILAVVDSVSGR